MTTPDVLVIGGGPIGLSVAWRLAQRDVRVVVCDEERVGRAWWAAAGMLTPVTEAYWGEDDLLALAVESMHRWPSFVDDLSQAGGADVGFEQEGVLAVGLDDDDRRVIDDLHRLHIDHGLDSTRLTSRECREREPLLASNVRGGLHAAGDGAVDPRCLVPALRAVAISAGVEIVSGSVERVEVSGGRVVGAIVDGDVRSAGTVVLAGGAWSGVKDCVPDEASPPVRPVYGEVVRLAARLDEHVPSQVIRAVVRGRQVYVVTRRDGEIVVGATSLDRGFDARVTAGGVYELLRDAFLVLPALAEAEFAEHVAGFRPGTPDNAPLIGWSGIDGLLLATGHYRNGILLTPLTSDAIAATVVGDAVPDVLAAARPDRFADAGFAAEAAS